MTVCPSPHQTTPSRRARTWQINAKRRSVRHKRWQTANGEYIWLLDCAVLTRDKDGAPMSIIGTWLDVTERKQAERERDQLLTQVREQAQQLQQIMDTAPEGIILLDSKSHIVLANPLGEKHLAILAGTRERDSLTHLGERSLQAILTTPPEGLWHEIAAQGREFQVIARPIEAGSTPAEWVLIARDVTEQRGIERHSQQQERLAALGQMAAGIAHLFSNIMAVITLYADMSLRAQVPPKVHDRLQIINQQARRASKLIQKIMDFSRSAVLERGPMDLLAFAKEQTRLLQRTLPENIKVNLEYGKEEYTIQADPTRIQQVMLNLATNAQDAMLEGGQLSIALERIRLEEGEPAPVPEMDAGEWICVKVADTGIGIPEETLPHIFDPFFTSKERGKGTGLGLAQVYGIVK